MDIKIFADFAGLKNMINFIMIIFFGLLKLSLSEMAYDKLLENYDKREQPINSGFYSYRNMVFLFDPLVANKGAWMWHKKNNQKNTKV